MAKATRKSKTLTGHISSNMPKNKPTYIFSGEISDHDTAYGIVNI